jgi:N6-adenosine-specific RNA methylase IME4/ParB-like chromosome segregation protein Spo0J
MSTKFHPLAEMLPLVEGAEFDRLVADIIENGLLNPITRYQGQTLDGRNRERACGAAGVEPRYVEFEGKDPAAFVFSQNLARRHLGPSERAMVAARMANLKWGQRSDRVEGQICLSIAAELLRVSERSVKSARVVLDHGIPELQEAVQLGRLAVYDAEKAARLPSEAQTQFLEAAAAGKTFSSWQTSYGRRQRAAELAAKITAMPTGQKRWPIILADPPWDYDISAPARERSHPAQHYAVMSPADICALPVAELAAESCVLFLWTTAPCLEQAFEVLRAWGFQYKSSLVWDKEIPGMGHWVRGQHEHLLIASKGAPPLPPTDSLPASIIRERRREHSRKPEAAYRIIETMYSTLARIELFARQARSGWDAWGNEVAAETAPDGRSDVQEPTRWCRQTPDFGPCDPGSREENERPS